MFRTLGAEEDAQVPKRAVRFWTPEASRNRSEAEMDEVKLAGG